jgi:hypothetical protein
MELREKEFTLKAKLNDKNLAELDNAKTVDKELGMATPSMMLCQKDEDVVKAEVPSLEKLKELHKECKLS